MDIATQIGLFIRERTATVAVVDISYHTDREVLELAKAGARSSRWKRFLQNWLEIVIREYRSYSIRIKRNVSRVKSGSFSYLFDNRTISKAT
jgi:hypothetical protein